MDSYTGRLRRSSREIVIASALTLAALAFIIAALVGGTVSKETDVGHVAVDDKIIK